MKITRLTKSFLLLLSILNFAWAQSGDVNDKLLISYVEIQEKLASDDLTGAKNAASKALVATSSDKELKKTFEQITKAKDLEAGREAFKAASKHVVESRKTNLPAEYMIAYCPMAGAKWIQKKGDLKNPYFGKEMLACGEKL